MIKNDVAIECEIHQQTCVVIDISNQCDSNKRYFCAKCLISDNIPKFPLLLEEANNYFSQFLKGFKEKIQAQSAQNLQIFDKLKANIQSLQTHVLSNLDKIKEKIEQYINKYEEKTKQCLDKVQEIDIHQYMKSPQDYTFQGANIDQNIFKTEFDKLNYQGLIENFLLLLENIDSSQISLEFESQLQNKNQLNNNKLNQRTPYLRVQCEKHKKEIIFIDLNQEAENNKRALCVKCVSKKQNQELLDVDDFRTLWNIYNDEKSNRLLQLNEIMKNNIESISQQMNTQLEQISIKFNETRQELKQNFQNQIEINNQQIIPKDWNNLTKDEVFEMADILSKIKSHQNFNEGDLIKQEMEIEQISQDSLILWKKIDLLLNPEQTVSNQDFEEEEKINQIQEQPQNQIQQTNNDVIQKFKVVFIGETKVGKSSIINQFIFDNFSESIESTVGIGFNSRKIKVNQVNVKLQLWDTAGQERFRSLIPSYIRDSKAAVICYDVTNAQSFQNIQYWLHEVREERGTDVLVVLIGNKTDLEEQRVIATENGKALAQDHNLLFFEVSAKDNNNIVEFFHQIAEILIDG